MTIWSFINLMLYDAKRGSEKVLRSCFPSTIKPALVLAIARTRSLSDVLAIHNEVEIKKKTKNDLNNVFIDPSSG